MTRCKACREEIHGDPIGIHRAGLPAVFYHAHHAPKRIDVGRRANALPVFPAEDLMCEHGVLRRLLLVYEEIVRRLGAGESIPPQGLRTSLELFARFGQDHHEKMEETYVFPVIERAGDKLVSRDTCVTLTPGGCPAVLRAQHEAGRRVMKAIQKLGSPTSTSGKARLVNGLRMLIRMYGPHAAEEDTVVFPTFRRLASPADQARIAESMDEHEHKLFPAGFQALCDQIADIEKRLGIWDLNLFTPRGVP